jgi:hypothetical protein
MYALPLAPPSPLQGRMSMAHSPSTHEATAVFTLASAAEQSALPYMHVTDAGQHDGQSDADSGGAAGHTGNGSAFCPKCQAPRMHCATRTGQSPKKHALPSGSAHSSPSTGAASGHSVRSRLLVAAPPSTTTTSLSLLPRQWSPATPTTPNATSAAPAVAREPRLARRLAQ